MKGKIMRKKSGIATKLALLCAALGVIGMSATPQAADPPKGSHLQSPQLAPELVSTTGKETANAISRGEQLWADRNLGANGLNCNVCHPSGAATHPETYPKYKQQLGRVVTVQEFINWCIVVALYGKSQELGGEVLTALEAYQAYENRGQIMEIGVPGP